MRAGEPPALAITLHEDDALVGAVVRREDRGILVSGLPPRHFTVIAEALAGTELPGVVGPVTEAEASPPCWTAPGHRFDQRLFALGTLTPPAGVPGERAPPPRATSTCGRWRRRSLPRPASGRPDRRPPRTTARGRIGRGSGCGRSTACPSRRRRPGRWWRACPASAPSTPRRSIVATATAPGVTAATSAGRWGRARDAWCCSPTPPTRRPIALYPRLGYRYRHDAVMLEFARPS